VWPKAHSQPPCGLHRRGHRTVLECQRYGVESSAGLPQATSTPASLVVASAEVKLLFEVVELILQRLLPRLISFPRVSLTGSDWTSGSSVYNKSRALSGEPASPDLDDYRNCLPRVAGADVMQIKGPAVRPGRSICLEGSPISSGSSGSGQSSEPCDAGSPRPRRSMGSWPGVTEDERGGPGVQACTRRPRPARLPQDEPALPGAGDDDTISGTRSLRCQLTHSGCSCSCATPSPKRTPRTCSAATRRGRSR
jgi:hypothetical protein